MWDELLVIADRLDEKGLYAEADEIDMILSMAAEPGGPVFNQFRNLLDTSEKKNIFKRLIDTFKGKTFTKEEINKLLEKANDLADQLSARTYQRIEDESARIGEGIKSLTDDILKLREQIQSGNKSGELHNAYVNDVMSLSNMLTIYNRMKVGTRGREDFQNAINIEHIAGNSIGKAQKLVKEFYQTRFSGFDWTQKFSQVMDSWNKIRVKRDETTKSMAEEQRMAEQSGAKFDPRDSKYSSTVKELDAFDKVVRKDAGELMKHYDLMRLADPEAARALSEQLGNIFEDVRKMSREELRGD